MFTSRQALLLLASALSASPPVGVAAFSAGAPRLSRRAAASTTARGMVFDSLFGKKEYGGACVMGDESIMSEKAHGTSEAPVQKDLRVRKRTAPRRPSGVRSVRGAPCDFGAARFFSHPAPSPLASPPLPAAHQWNCDNATADRICNFNRHYAEHAGYWAQTSFIGDVKDEVGEVTFYDSNTGKPLFVAPRGRDMASFLAESGSHGWPSFRDEEVVWDDVRVLADGECVSTAGTHLVSSAEFSGFCSSSTSLSDTFTAFDLWLQKLAGAGRNGTGPTHPLSLSGTFPAFALWLQGHNLPDGTGNRYCINLVSVAGRPKGE